MLILVKEICTYIRDKDETECTDGVRQYKYKVSNNVKTLAEGIQELENNFNSENIVWLQDDFFGEYVDSQVVAYSLVPW